MVYHGTCKERESRIFDKPSYRAYELYRVYELVWRRGAGGDAIRERATNTAHVCRTLTAQKMGVKAHEAARLASCIETQKEAPSMSLEEFKKQLEEARKVEERVKNNIRETKRREQAYARNRRTSRIPGAIIANAAIA